MTAGDVPKTIEEALWRETKLNQSNGDDVKMMNQANEMKQVSVPNHMDVVYMNANLYKQLLNHGEHDTLPLQYDVQQVGIFDQNTGRRIVVDGNGRRVTPKREMTGTQLVRINSMRNQVGLKYLSEHNVKSMSIDSASLMIDDLMFFIAKYEELRMNFGYEYKKLEQERDELYQALEDSMNDPAVRAELIKKRQAEQMKKDLK